MEKQPHPPLWVGSLFSGIGGLDLGLELAGMEVRWQVEQDPWCQRVLATHWPDVTRYGDVCGLTGDELEPVDLICGGFPCQPVSVAGGQKGRDDARWLWPEFRRVVGLLRPRYVLVENVPGLFTANGGHAFGEVIGDLADLGYDCEWTMLSAADVGAPHLRKRVWIVADADADRRDPKSDGQGRESRSSCGSTVALGERRVDQRRRLGQEPRMADAESHDGGSWSEQTRREARPRGSHPRRQGKPEYALQTVADADHQRCVGGRQQKQQEQQGSRRGEPDGRLSNGRFFDAQIGGHWPTEPDVGRVAHGVPHRVDRLKGLGNAVVPQCAEWIGRRILATPVTR
jgi:DNA (cytosine-5)-methyltransferase 1